MRMDYGLNLELSQKLIMTPQLCQAIAILQLSSLELAELVEKELLENPVLEEDDSKSSDQELSEADTEPVSPSLEKYLEWDEYFSDGANAGHMPVADEKPSFEAFTGNTVSLHEHLEFQLHLALLGATGQSIGAYIIGCIDENGYLCCSVADIALALTVSEQQVIQVLNVIHTFDPAGVGARNVKECLTIQTRQRGIDNSLVLAIIADFLEDVAQGRYKQIAEKLNSTPQLVQQAVDIIRTLDPKPGQAFGGGADLTYIVPDIIVEKVNGEYVIRINDGSVPQLTINPYYRRIAQDIDDTVKKFVEGRLNAAVWLIKSIEQRRRTLYNVMQAILNLQRDFFDCGVKFLHPLTMKKVADCVGIHESTVSRAIANKYVATAQGLYSLRIFFSTGITGVSGDSLSSTRD